VRAIRRTSQFKKDAKTATKQGRSLENLRSALSILQAGSPLPDSFFDHPLKGGYKGYRECHIQGDWCMIYRIADEGELILVRLGTHSELFGS
jgi:mRNA interferase YafQ